MQGLAKLHHIQRAVLLALASRSPQRFTELQPPRVPNNTFSYHLKQLIATNYIRQTDDGYVATRKALKLIGFAGDSYRQPQNPVVLTMLYVTNPEGEVLLLNRDKNPYRGWYGLPSGAIHVGESVDEAALRELHEKTTISSNLPLQRVGVLDFQYREEGTDDIFIHMLAFIYTCHIENDYTQYGALSTPYGQLSWSKLGRRYILPEVAKARAMVESHSSYESVRFIEPAHAPVLQFDSPARVDAGQ